jgi:hypothetical protein
MNRQECFQQRLQQSSRRVFTPSDFVSAGLASYGCTTNTWSLFSVPCAVVTVIYPVVAPLGTIAVRNVGLTTVKLAASQLNDTVLPEVNPCPRI